jgi:hypothetical protein
VNSVWIVAKSDDVRVGICGDMIDDWDFVEGGK